MTLTPPRSSKPSSLIHDEGRSSAGLLEVLRRARAAIGGRVGALPLSPAIVTYEASWPPSALARASAKFQGPGVYETTITQSRAGGRYLAGQLG